MGVRSFFRDCYNLGLEEQERRKTQRASNNESSSDLRPLVDSDIDSFLQAADEREDPLWENIDLYLSYELRRRWPIRAYKLKKEIAWLRNEASKDDLEWGRPS